MLTTREIKGVLVCRKPPKGKEYTKDGLPRRGRKIGKVFKTVFDPSGLRVVGFIVRRPDLLWMFKRPEKFLALDAMDTSEGVVRATKGGASWDDAAIKRNGLDWDKCIIWEGMQVRTSEGEVLGHVDDISFDEVTGDIDSLFLDDGGTARALIGSVEIPHELMVGYTDDKGGYLVVKPEAAECKLTGGLAAKAGEASAKASIAAKQAGHEAGKAVGKAVDAGSYGLGKGIGRIKNSITGAVDEYRKEAPAPKKKAEASSGAKKSGGASGSTSSKAKSGSSKSSSGTKKASSTSSSKSKSASQSASKAVADHMKAAGSMFSDFKKEFDKASKGK